MKDLAKTLRQLLKNSYAIPLILHNFFDHSSLVMMNFLRPRRILQYSLRRMKHTVAVAMSGGIDSSVSALLLKEKGYNCVGVFMKNWDFSDEVGEYKCSYTEDKKDVEDVCKHLGIPLVEVSS
jgi:tRNA(Ile)-lysidine synthase TilS/MesJ